MTDSQGRPRYKLVVSDFHLGKGRYFKDGTQNILEDFVADREFAEFLAYHRSGPFADAEVELILNGDILNLLQIDYFGVHTHLMTERSQKIAVEKIIEGHPEFFEALKKFAATPGHSIAYVVGNHDAGMLFKAPREVFSRACGSTVAFYDVCYLFDGIYVEHGQQYERFARSDPRRPFLTRGLPEPVLNLPWGSLFSAILLPKLKQERPHIDKVRPFSTFLSWTFWHDLGWGLRAAWIIILFTLQTILFKSRYQLLGGVGATWELLREVSVYPNYDKIAFKILDEREDVNVVIFGHTHILRYRQWREGKEYFNEGTWNEVTSLELAEYGTRTRLTYAFVEYQSQERPKVRLKEWKGVWRPESEVLA